MLVDQGSNHWSETNRQQRNQVRYVLSGDLVSIESVTPDLSLLFSVLGNGDGSCYRVGVGKIGSMQIFCAGHASARATLSYPLTIGLAMVAMILVAMQR
jgi:hypothetical protein